MIFGFEESKILKIANEYQSEMTDGVVQYNYEDGELFGAGFTTGTVENPANPFIEVYRLPQGERGEFDCKCHENGDCPFWIENDDEICGGHFDDDKVIEHSSYPKTRIDCCIDACADDIFDEDVRMGIEEQVRDVLSDYIGKTLGKLNEIRVAISDIYAPYDFWNVRQDDWEMRVLDSYVDDAMENGLCLEDCSDWDILDAEIQHIISNCELSENEYVRKAGVLVEAGRLDEALKVLQ